MTSTSSAVLVAQPDFGRPHVADMKLAVDQRGLRMTQVIASRWSTRSVAAGTFNSQCINGSK